MGRELGIYRIDFFGDKKAVIRHSDFNLCGRTEFTGDIARLFYNHEHKDLLYLLLSKEKREPGSYGSYPNKEVMSVSVKVEDPYWEKQEFVMDCGFVYREAIQEIVNEHMDEDDKLLHEAEIKLEDARIARQRSANLEVFEEFSDLIEALNSYIEDFNKEADNYISEIMRVEKQIKYDTADENITASYVLLTYSE